MSLLVSVRHVGAHPDELQHGVSIQSSINLGKTFPRISRKRIIPSTQILVTVFVYLPPFISQILDFICRMVEFYFDLFWMTWHWICVKFLVCSKDRAYSENRNRRMRQVVSYRGWKNNGKSLTVRVRKWSRSLKYRGGGSLQEVPTVRLWLGKFWCFELAVAYGRRSLMGDGRLQELVAHDGSIYTLCCSSWFHP